MFDEDFWRVIHTVHGTLLAGGMNGTIIGTFVTAPMSSPPDDARRPPLVSPDTSSAESSIDLLVRAKGGDETAMEALCARYLPRLKRWAHGRLPGSSRGVLDSEDLAQDVLFRAVEHVETFEPRHAGAFQGYVRRILMNRIRDEVRKVQRRPMSTALEEEQHEAADPSPLEMAIGRQAVERYEAALARLSDPDREMIVARLELGFSAAEIASEFGKPSVGAAQVAVSRALVRLAREMVRA